MIIYSYYHSRTAIPGNITNSLSRIVYECAARVNNTQGNERVMFPRYRRSTMAVTILWYGQVRNHTTFERS